MEFGNQHFFIGISELRLALWLLSNLSQAGCQSRPKIWWLLDPWLLGCRNGTLVARTSELFSHLPRLLKCFSGPILACAFYLTLSLSNLVILPLLTCSIPNNPDICLPTSHLEALSEGFLDGGLLWAYWSEFPMPFDGSDTPQSWLLQIEYSKYVISGRILSGLSDVNMEHWSTGFESSEITRLFILLWITS